MDSPFSLVFSSFLEGSSHATNAACVAITPRVHTPGLHVQLVGRAPGKLHAESGRDMARLRILVSASQLPASLLKPIRLSDQVTVVGGMRHVGSREELQLVMLMRQEVWIMRIRFWYRLSVAPTRGEPTTIALHQCGATGGRIQVSSGGRRMNTQDCRKVNGGGGGFQCRRS